METNLIVVYIFVIYKELSFALTHLNQKKLLFTLKNVEICEAEW